MTVALFYQFLIARILERIQQISKEVCRGCEMRFKFATLHPCESNSLFQRITLFLPSAKAEALEKIDRLVKNYKRNFDLFLDEEEHVEVGESFLRNLQPHHLLDIRYINEESDSTFDLDCSWREPTENVLTQICNEVFGEADFSLKDANDEEEIIVKRRKSVPKAKKMKAPKQECIELIADTPRKKTKTSPKKPPRQQPIGKKRKSIHKLPCDDPSCCKDSIYY